jgi:hypothetical protein
MMGLRAPSPRRKQVHKIAYPNGKIYVGMDLTGTALYMGSPSAYEQIVADLELEPGQFELTLRKEILWECETATDAEVRAMEKQKIRETGLTIPRSATTGYPGIARPRRFNTAGLPTADGSALALCSPWAWLTPQRPRPLSSKSNGMVSLNRGWIWSSRSVKVSQSGLIFIIVTTEPRCSRSCG